MSNSSTGMLSLFFVEESILYGQIFLIRSSYVFQFLAVYFSFVNHCLIYVSRNVQFFNFLFTKVQENCYEEI